MNFRILIYISIICASLCHNAMGQKKMSWRKRAKLAEEYYKSGDFQEAATQFQKAFKEKTDKLEYTYKAGISFLEFRDYGNAVKALEPVKNQNSDFDKVGYKYALALKQSGQTEAAKEAFEAFLIDYQGEEKEKYKDIVDNEIRGCNFALKAKEYTDDGVSLEHLDHKINTNKTEFAPIPFNQNVLYFSTTSKGVAKIHRTQKNDGEWQHPQVPQIFLGKMERSHFGNGTFTADGRRFYFTQCEVDGKPKCDIYVMKQEGGVWSRPTLLPDYVNAPEANTTHPYVVTTPTQEILYFASTRPGGRGGLDLWYTTVPKGGGSFTLPKNLGRNINTRGDDISPFYHSPTGTLYFSSNGRVSAGGLDIFKSKGEKLQWEVAQNMGFPVNSTADDLYYTISESHGGGYLVSNRAFMPARRTTTDDDIFYFAQENIYIELSGKITDANRPNDGAMAGVNVKLFEMTSEDEELINESTLEEGVYVFDLEPRKSYVISFYKEGYQAASFPVQTADQSEQLANDVALIPVKVEKEEPDWDKIKYEIVAAEYNSNDNAYALPKDGVNPETQKAYDGNYLIVYKELQEIAKLGDEHKLYYDEGGNPQPYRAPVVAIVPVEKDTLVAGTGTEDGDDAELYEIIYNQKKLAPEGVVYKIQVAAVRKFKSYKYEDLKKVGRLAMEKIDGGVSRVLVVDIKDNKEGIEGFKSKGRALNVLSYILNNSQFKYAFVIKYQNGKRVGEGFRGWDEEEGLQESKTPKSTAEDKYEGF